MQLDHDLVNKREEPKGWWARVQSQLQRWRVTLSFLFAVITLILAEPTVQLILVGGCISLLGACLRAWAVGHLRKDQLLSTGGPYAYTRNPLYLGSFLLGLGVVTASGSPILLGLFLVLFILLFTSAMSREASHLQKLFPDDYPAYRDAVPAFFPRLTPYRAAAPTRFSRRLYRRHREYQVALVLLLVFGILAGKAFLGRRPSSAALAQTERAALPDRLSGSLPFAEGETLEYEVHFSKAILSGRIGTLSFTFDRSTEPPLVDDYLIRATAISGGVWPKILGIKIEDVFESFVDPTDFGVKRTRKRFSHGRKKWFELAVFNRNGPTVMFVKRDLTRSDAKPEVKNESTQSWVQDIVSGTYYLRARPLRAGDTIEFPVGDSGKTMDLQVKVLAEEQIHTRLGQFTTLKLEPLIFGEGKLIRKKGTLWVWITDDRRRLPVRAVVQGSFGRATLELKTVKGLSN